MRLRRHSSSLQTVLHFSVVLACSGPDAPIQGDVPPVDDSTGLDAADAGRTEPGNLPPGDVTPDGSMGGAPTATARQAVRLSFVARVGDEPFACGTSYRTASDAEFTPADLRLFVQDIALIDRDGNEQPMSIDVRAPWQIDGVALIDFEDASAACLAGTRETNIEITGHVAPGDYRGLVFSNGVPTALNHADPSRLPPPLQAGSMSWGWLQGYRFLMAEIAATAASGDAAAPGSALLHVGSTACSGNPGTGGIACTKPNRNRVRLPDYDPAGDAIVIDIAELFADMDLASVTTCHSSGEDCTPLFERLGLDLMNGLATESQRVYRVEPASATDP